MAHFLIILSKRFRKPTISSIPPVVEENSFLLLESGDYLLLESGDKLILE